MRLKLASLVLLCVGMAAAPVAASGKLYGNARFGFFVDIPAAFSVMDPEPENGDGRIFHTADRTATVTASGGWIIEDDFAAEIVKTKGFAVDDGWTLTYESKVSKSLATFSAQKGNRILYERDITSCGGKAHAGYRLEYPVADKAKYDPMIKGLNASLKPGIGNCG